ncbi:MAG: prepilin peptidase [Deltaproteobacteria bacterium]|nr:prepilin peptidase [Deltaproteobacteria bacterium]
MNYLIVGILGSIIGSFLGALSYRIPRRFIKKWFEDEELADLGVTLEEDPEIVNSKRSRCPNCKKVLSWWELIPIISWLLLRGKCKSCNERISFRYPLIEFLTVFSAVLTYYLLGLSFEGLVLFIILCVLILASSVDIECFILPDFLTVPLIVAGLIYCFVLLTTDYFAQKPFSQEVLDSVFGGLVLPGVLTIFSWIFSKIKGKEGFGFGDIKLLSGLGFLLGFNANFFVLMVASVLAILNAVINKILGKGEIFGQYYPFGPFLVAGVFIYLLTYVIIFK